MSADLAPRPELPVPGGRTVVAALQAAGKAIEAKNDSAESSPSAGYCGSTESCRVRRVRRGSLSVCG
jgi:hypothetical protein